RCPPDYKVLILVAVIEVTAGGTGRATDERTCRRTAASQSPDAGTGGSTTGAATQHPLLLGAHVRAGAKGQTCHGGEGESGLMHSELSFPRSRRFRQPHARLPPSDNDVVRALIHATPAPAHRCQRHHLFPVLTMAYNASVPSTVILLP